MEFCKAAAEKKLWYAAAGGKFYLETPVNLGFPRHPFILKGLWSDIWKLIRHTIKFIYLLSTNINLRSNIQKEINYLNELGIWMLYRSQHFAILLFCITSYIYILPEIERKTRVIVCCYSYQNSFDSDSRSKWLKKR